jgi:phosphoribosyl 1,2-cyclic phosphate phosphodiesterase
MTLVVKILGSGTSTGVPVLGCSCRVCLSGDPKNQRWRASIAFQSAGKHPVVVDTGPEFRLQALRAGISTLQHVFYTHLHADHCHGFDDLRGLYFNSQKSIHCWLHPEGIRELRHRFHYAFEDTGYLGGRPDIQLHALPENHGVVSLGDYEVETFLVPHGNAMSNILRIGSFAYATDFKTLPDAVIRAWKGRIHTMVASGLRWREHKTHSTIGETLEIFQALGVERGVITHINHEIDYHQDQLKMPSGVELAWDGMELVIPN